MQQRGYADFSLDMHHAIGRAGRMPTNATIEMTYRCPLACSHCYNNLPMGDRSARVQELSTQEHKRILDEITDAGALWLLYTGGEIFARPDFLEIYRHAKSKGLLITLFTNGILINERIADELAAWKPFSLEITLYGATAETYETLTQKPGSFKRCIRGIELLLERGIPVKLKGVAVSINSHEIPAMKQLAADYGLGFKYDAMMNPRIDCGMSPLAVRLTPEEAVALDLSDADRLHAWDGFAQKYIEPPRQHQKDQIYKCGGAMNAYAIDPYGHLSLCILSQQDKFDLRQGSFSEGWNHFLGNVRQKPVTKETKCTSCHLKALCGMCPAQGELENNDPESPVEFLCEVAHLRAHIIGAEVPPHGDCAYCKGGASYDALLAAVERLKKGERPSRVRPRGLPIVYESSASAASADAACACA